MWYAGGDRFIATLPVCGVLLMLGDVVIRAGTVIVVEQSQDVVEDPDLLLDLVILLLPVSAEVRRPRSTGLGSGAPSTARLKVVGSPSRPRVSSPAQAMILVVKEVGGEACSPSPS